MLRIYAVLSGLLYVTGHALVERREVARREERGASVLEWTVLTAGVLVLALGLLALIRAAYNKYSGDIR